MKTEQIDGGTLETWTVEEVEKGLAEHSIVLIDVRTPPEYMFECIPGALLAPMSHFDAAQMPEEGKKRIVFHCGSGIRSGKVAQQYLAAGHDRIAHLEGGFGAWKQAKKPFIGIDPASGSQRRVNG